MRFTLVLCALTVVLAVAVFVLVIAPVHVASFGFLAFAGERLHHFYRIFRRHDYSLIVGLDHKPLNRPEIAAKWWMAIDLLIIFGGVFAFAAYWLSGNFGGAMKIYWVFFLLPALLLLIVTGARFRDKTT
jgi:hypothetical protein